MELCYIFSFVPLSLSLRNKIKNYLNIQNNAPKDSIPGEQRTDREVFTSYGFPP